MFGLSCSEVIIRGYSKLALLFGVLLMKLDNGFTFKI
jgi:hypothetical protein